MMVSPIPCIMYRTAMAVTVTTNTLVTIIDPRRPKAFINRIDNSKDRICNDKNDSN